jgi:NAD-dependent deacetylase
MGQVLEPEYAEAARAFLSGKRRAALTGAGISVGCGVPDFRSQDGLWSRFDPGRYATLEAFLRRPAEAWTFYRTLGRLLWDKRPGNAHAALAQLETSGLLEGVVTQNVDGFHREAGSRRVFEIHGEYRHLQCLSCGGVERSQSEHFQSSEVPACRSCGSFLKPNVVLFGEAVRQWDEVESLMDSCDVLLVIGTSGSVFPGADLPLRVRMGGGRLLEFNLEETSLTGQCAFHFRGPVEETIPRFVRTVAQLGGLRAATEGTSRKDASD